MERWRALHSKRRFIRILFVAHTRQVVEPYLHELERARFAIWSRLARTADELQEQLLERPHDAIVCDDGLRNWSVMDALSIARRHDAEMPVLVMTGLPDVPGGAEDEMVAEYLWNGATDCIARDRPHVLALSVALAMEERALEDERRRTENLHARYLALTENPTYGICRCEADDRLRDVNEALAAMLGHSSPADMSWVSVTSDLLRNHPEGRTVWLNARHRPEGIKGLEMEWTDRSGRLVPVRLSGASVRSGADGPDALELIVEDLTAQRALQEQLRWEAHTDGLTGLVNYRRFAEMVDAEIRGADRTGRSFALLLCDLNGMKQINDQHGHVAGDTALRRFADVLRVSCRSIDTPARYGGDEFAVVLPEAGARQASVVGDRVCRFLMADAERPALSVSVGSAVFPEDGDTMERLLTAADRELYKMKMNRILRVVRG